MRYDIPIDFCPKCNNKRITIIMGKQYEKEYSLTGKCIRSSRDRYVTYMMLKCNKCKWKSSSWSEAGYEDEEEYEKLQEIYLERNKR